MTNYEHGDTSPEKSSFLMRCIATGCFVGYSPWASGTVGSFAGAVCFLIPEFRQPFILLPAILLVFIAGVHASAKVAAFFGNVLTDSARRAKERFQPEGHAAADPSIVVVDEIVGMWLTMIAIPISYTSLIIGFLAFRLFDIVKPYPARQLEHVGGGWGIMLDDVVAAIYANIATRTLVALGTAFYPVLFSAL